MRVQQVLIVAVFGVVGLGQCERVQVVLEDDVPRHLCSRVLDNLEVSLETMMKRRKCLLLASWLVKFHPSEINLCLRETSVKQQAVK